MIVCFFKPSVDKECKCEIVKFVDRIWLNKEGNAFCIRDFVVYVQEKSIPLNGIRLFIPYRNVLELQDLTETGYDNDYLFNTFHAGGFSVKHLDPALKRAIVDMDGIRDVEVCGGIGQNLEIGLDPVPPKKEANILSIDYSTYPVQPGKFRHLRISFKVTSLLDSLFEGNVYRIALNYFDGSDFRDEIRTLDIHDLEIPLRKFYKEIEEDGKKIYHGGVDIFLYLDPDIKGVQFNANKEVVAKHEPNATEGQRNRQKYIWRARLSFPKLDTLTMDNPAWELHGYVSDPYQLKKITQRLENLESTQGIIRQKVADLWKDRKWVVIGVLIGGGAVVFGVYNFVVSLMK